MLLCCSATLCCAFLDGWFDLDPFAILGSKVHAFCSHMPNGQSLMTYWSMRSWSLSAACACVCDARCCKQLTWSLQPRWKPWIDSFGFLIYEWSLLIVATAMYCPRSCPNYSVHEWRKRNSRVCCEAGGGLTVSLHLLLGGPPFNGLDALAHSLSENAFRSRMRAATPYMFGLLVVEHLTNIICVWHVWAALQKGALHVSDTHSRDFGQTSATRESSMYTFDYRV